MKLGSIAYRNIYRNLRRSILSATAIMVAAMSIVLLFSLLGGMKADITYNLQTYSTGGIRIRDRDFTKNERLNPMHLTIENVDILSRELLETPGVSVVSPRISFPARIYRGEENYNAMGVGLDFSTESAFQDLGPDVLQKGRLPESGKNEALLGYKLAEKAGVGIGDKITLLSSTASRGTNAITLEVTGLAVFPLSGMSDNTFYAPLDRVQHLLRMPDQVQEMLVKFDADVDERALTASLPSGLSDSENLEITYWQDIETSYSFIQMAETVYNIFALFFFFLASTVILNTTIMVIFERMKEIGTLSAMGMNGKDLVRLFFLESLYIGIIGSFFGVLLGILFTHLLSITGIDFGSAMEGVDFDIAPVLYPKLSLKSTVLVFFYSVVMTSVVSIFPSRKASRIEPVEALRAV
ncbi:MAG: ABC transporter permease [Spirochaetales bacterium]|nr:ABC transporter permease [Spirochaetales bacterium]